MLKIDWIIHGEVTWGVLARSGSSFLYIGNDINEDPQAPVFLFPIFSLPLFTIPTVVYFSFFSILFAYFPLLVCQSSSVSSSLPFLLVQVYSILFSFPCQFLLSNLHFVLSSLHVIWEGRAWPHAG